MMRKVKVNGQWVEVSEEVYQEIMRSIWRTRYYARKEGRCSIPWWACEGDCGACAPHAAGTEISENTPIGGGDSELTISDTLADDAPSPEEDLMIRDLEDALHVALARLSAEDRRIAELIADHSEREAAKVLGMPRSTLKRRWSKIQATLQAELAEYYY